MKRIVLSLVALGLAVLGVVGIVPSLPSLVGVQAEVQAATRKTITLDVALDCRAFNYSRGIPLAEIVRGDGFIINGKIFPAGTLRPGNDPNDPGSIGDWVSRGTTTATLAEHLANPESIGIFSTNYYLLNDGPALVSEGWFKPGGVGRAAITGGMGAFSGASGEVSGVNISTNSTGCPNTRFKFNIQPGSVPGFSND